MTAYPITAHRVSTPDIPFGLDALLADAHLVGGLQPTLGEMHLRTIGVNAFIGQTVPGVLDALNNLPFGYRWVSRFMPLDKQDAAKSPDHRAPALVRQTQRHLDAGEGSGHQSESPLEDADAVNKAADADAALAVLGGDLASFGYFTPTVTIMDEDLDRLESSAARCSRYWIGRAWCRELEDTNAVEAWLSSLPGQAYANCRRPIVSSANLVDMMPMSAVWAGPGARHSSGRAAA